MDKREIILAGLSTGNRDVYTPVQVQKMFFLIDRNVGDKVGGPHFDFEPYNYGPFDKGVYSVLMELTLTGDVEVIQQKKWMSYKLTTQGQSKGNQLFKTLSREAQSYIKKVSNFVRKSSFADLVSAIYKAYPEMKANSVFQD